MKKLLFLSFCLLGVSHSALSSAIENTITQNSNDIIQLTAPLSGTLEKTNKMKAQEAFYNAMSDDMMIAYFLTIPFEKRQYYFPSIHRSTYISHKIKTHPEIIIWKNKKPTNIAPHLQEYAKKHLNQLSPEYYTFLDPEFWKPIPSEVENDIKKVKIKPLYLSEKEGVDFSYPTIKELFNLSNKKSDDYLKSSIQEEDIFALNDVMTHIDLYQPEKMSFENLTEEVHTLLTQQINRSIADPFKMYILAIEQLGEGKSFEKFVQKHGFKNITDFAEKADKILKAHQALRINLFSAIEIAKYRKEALEKEPTKETFSNKDIDYLTMYTRMHLAPIGEIYFVKKHQNILQGILKSNFIEKGFMISID